MQIKTIVLALAGAQSPPADRATIIMTATKT